MNNTNNNFEVDGEMRFEIAAQAISTPNNPAIDGSDYWNLNATAFGTASFTSAWTYATGKGVTIGLIDEGVNYTHLDLAGSYDTAIDFDPFDLDDNDARPDTDNEQHGTEVAGIIAGAGTNNFGTIGAAPDATITASYLRYGSSMTVDDLGALFAHQAEYDVSNNSWGFTAAFSDNFADSYFDVLQAGIETAATTGRNGLGTALVFAAGNGKLVIGGQNIGDDANFHNLSNTRFGIAVGAHDSNGEAAFFSSPGANVLVSAPGVGLTTTYGSETGATGSATVSGTSFAAPMVSAAIALMLEVNPNLGYRDIQEILAISADPSRSGTAVANGATNVNGGGMMFDREMGFGALNALSATNLARSWTSQHTAANEEHLHADFEMPDSADPYSQTISVDVTNAGDAGFSLDFVQLTLSIDDSALQDMRIELISPDGTTTLIAPNLRAAAGRTQLDFTFSSVATWGESPYGTWTVAFSHPSGSDAFHLLGASIDLYGDTTTADDEFFFTASYARLVAANADRAVISDSDGGTDRLNFAAAASGAVVDLASPSGNKLGDVAFTLDGAFENIFGSVHADTFAGSESVNIIDGDFGNDWIDGRGGDDFIDGGQGNDTLFGGAGADSIDGGAGNDVAAYEHAVTLDFVTGAHTGDAAGDLFVRIEQFSLSAGRDTFLGSLAAINDKVHGNGGMDYLSGGAGNDWLDGGSGVDVLVGGTGDDTFLVDSKDDSIIERKGEGVDTVRATVGFELTAGVENLILSGNARAGIGNNAANVIDGNGLANKLEGRGGADLLEGHSGRDYIIGGIGADTIVGGRDADKLTGSAGQDVFLFTTRAESTCAASDRITDFRHKIDKIDLSSIDTGVKYAGNNAFQFIGTQDFSGRQGQLRIEQMAHKTYVLADVDGNGHADFRIVLDGHVGLTAADFII